MLDKVVSSISKAGFASLVFVAASMGCGSSGAEGGPNVASDGGSDAITTEDGAAGEAGGTQSGGTGGGGAAGSAGGSSSGAGGSAGSPGGSGGSAGSGAGAPGGSGGSAGSGASAPGGSGGSAGSAGSGGSDGYCGDGVINTPAEECDGSELGGATCVSVTLDPLASGEPTCRADCTLSTTGCAWCGDGVANNGEPCDGNDFGTATCATELGVVGAGGSLSCWDCEVSTSACWYCGDGVRNGSEACDGYDMGGATCSSVLGSGQTGTLACHGSCVFNTSGCHAACTPNCAGKECGGDGCGGQCGTCSGSSTCQNGQCQPTCTPNCVGKQCGHDGCGGLCGSCGGGAYCEDNQCTTCTDACESLVDTTLPYNTSGCTPTDNDCASCGGPSCGLRYSYTCGGTPVGSEYAPPDIPGCKRRQGSANSFCCPQAACVRYSGADAYCLASFGLPIGRVCHAEAAAAPGCVPSLYYSNVVCCPS